MKQGYVSDFTLFINHYLANHPEVVAEQKRGWDRYWNPDADQVVLAQNSADTAPNDGYGFFLPAGIDKSH